MARTKLVKGVNDLATVRSDLAREWHQNKNGLLRPDQVTPGSGKKVWWKCSQGHEWEAQITSRNIGQGCPYCHGKRVINGVNDLATLKPQIAAEWHPTKNGSLTPHELSVRTQTKVWWKCNFGHEWVASVANRKSSGCPICSRARPRDTRTLAEAAPHIFAEVDKSKNAYVDVNNLTYGSGKKIWWKCSEGHEWEATPNSRTAMGSGCPYCSGTKAIIGKTDLATCSPGLLSEWDFQANSDVDPQKILPKANVVVSWKCYLGHKWTATVFSRSTQGSGCPVCAGKQLLSGFNDLATKFPDVAAKWHPTLNGSTKPDQVLGLPLKKAWWFCDKGHEWEALISNQPNVGCPVCSNYKLVIGINDLATMRPDLITEWHPLKNGEMTPDSVSVGNSQSFWWICSQGHEWQANCSNRVANGSGCPSCAKHGYDSTSPGVFYFITNKNLNASKVGIANQTSKRLANWLAGDWELVRKWEHANGQVIRTLEGRVLRWIRGAKSLPPYLGKIEMGVAAGWSETFERGYVDDLEVIEFTQNELARLLKEIL